MGIHVIENKIDSKIKQTVKASTSRKFNMYESEHIEKDWIISELKKANYYYTFTLSSLIFIMILFFLFFILKSIGIIATSTHDSSKLVLLLSTLAVSGTVHYFGLKKEKLSHVIYLFNLKNDLEKIELNQRKNQHGNSSTFN